MNLWVVVIGMGIVSFSIRMSMLVFVHHSTLPAAFRDALRFVMPAVLAAFIATEVLFTGEDDAFDAGNGQLVAALLAAAVAWLSGSVWLTIGTGMAALWLLRWLT